MNETIIFLRNERTRRFDLKKNFMVFFGMYGSVYNLKDKLRVTGRFNSDLHQRMNSSFFTELIKFGLLTVVLKQAWWIKP